MTESPRWLINRGKFSEAAQCLNRIAKVNGKKTIIEEKYLEDTFMNEKPEKVYGILSLFSNTRLARNTLVLMHCW